MRKALTITLLAAALALSGCSSDQPDDQAAPKPTATTAEPTEPEPAEPTEPEPAEPTEPEPEPQPANNGEIAAWTVCQLFTEQTLANPETVNHDAQFESAGHIGPLWTVMAGLTTQDGQRLDYLCSVRYEPTDDGEPSNDWRLVRLTDLSGKVL
jgi:hypothetical protein